MTDLLVVPRIEFGQLTDDELGSDLDEGEVCVCFFFKRSFTWHFFFRMKVLYFQVKKSS